MTDIGSKMYCRNKVKGTVQNLEQLCSVSDGSLSGWSSSPPSWCPCTQVLGILRGIVDGVRVGMCGGGGAPVCVCVCVCVATAKEKYGG